MAQPESQHFVADGCSRSAVIVIARHREARFRLIAERRRRYAAEFAAANWLSRWQLRLRIRHEINELLQAELDRLASPYSLY